MDKNYYCNEVWFYSHAQALMYADHVLKTEGKYYAVYTRAEMDSQVREMVNSIINHELECGK